MVSINLSLPDDLQALAEQAARTGGISVEDFVRNCVALQLQSPAIDSLPEADAEHIEYMRKGLEKAEQEIADGLGQPFDLEEIKKLGREKLNQRQTADQ